MIRPRALRQGDQVGFVAPAGSLADPSYLERSVRAAQAMGFGVKVGKSCDKVYGYLAGGDELRADDLNRMFLDDTVRAIVCMRGGYGAPRILDRLDYRAAAEHPKILLGYSDITALHIAYGQKSGLCTFHGPMPATEWIWPSFDRFTRDGLLRALTRAKPLGPIENPPGCPLEALSPGHAEGELAGGNLSLICALMGTPYQLDARGKILLIEDVDESVHRVDRMLTMLRLAGVFDVCAGVVLGGFTNCRAEHPKRSLTLRQAIEDVLLPFDGPVVWGYKIGHCEPKLTLPLGARCALDERGLRVLESALRAPARDGPASQYQSEQGHVSDCPQCRRELK